MTTTENAMPNGNGVANGHTNGSANGHIEHVDEADCQCSVCLDHDSEWREAPSDAIEDTAEMLAEGEGAPVSRKHRSDAESLVDAVYKDDLEAVRAALAPLQKAEQRCRLASYLLTGACQYGAGRTAAALLAEYGADVEQPDQWLDGTPLIHAANYGHKDLVKLLLKEGANPNAQDTLGQTPLIMAVLHKDRPQLVAQLVEGGADVDKTCSKGMTPLCYASKMGHVECIQALADAGADMAHADSSGLTPKEHAEDSASTEALTLVNKLIVRQETKSKRVTKREPAAGGGSSSGGSGEGSGLSIGQAELAKKEAEAAAAMEALLADEENEKSVVKKGGAAKKKKGKAKIDKADAASEELEPGSSSGASSGKAAAAAAAAAAAEEAAAAAAVKQAAEQQHKAEGGEEDAPAASKKKKKKKKAKDAEQAAASTDIKQQQQQKQGEEAVPQEAVPASEPVAEPAAQPSAATATADAKKGRGKKSGSKEEEQDKAPAATPSANAAAAQVRAASPDAPAAADASSAAPADSSSEDPVQLLRSQWDSLLEGAAKCIDPGQQAEFVARIQDLAPRVQQAGISTKYSKKVLTKLEKVGPVREALQSALDADPRSLEALQDALDRAKQLQSVLDPQLLASVEEALGQLMRAADKAKWDRLRANLPSLPRAGPSSAAAVGAAAASSGPALPQPPPMRYRPVPYAPPGAAAPPVPYAPGAAYKPSTTGRYTPPPAYVPGASTYAPGAAIGAQLSHLGLHDDDDECIICMNAPKEMLLVPCGHFKFCSACVEQSVKPTMTCCFCNQPVTSMERVQP